MKHIALRSTIGHLILTADLRTAAIDAGEDVDAALVLARQLGSTLPQPASGRTSQRWAVLSGLGRVNLSVARVVEAHCDALAILAEAGLLTEQRRAATWGVFAAESPGTRLDASTSDGGTTVSGSKPWCSLGDRLDAALVTAHTDGGRRLYAVDLRHPGVRADPPEGWVARGLRTVTSGPVAFDCVPATPVGATDWYLRRPGFAWGGIGVAACWLGGALGIADTLHRKSRTTPNALTALHVGAVDLALHAASVALAHAAARVDSGPVSSDESALLALRTRAVVADTVERVLHHAGHALGPAPLAFDADHAARVADLALYVRQHHGERDLAALGAAVLGAATLGDTTLGDTT